MKVEITNINIRREGEETKDLQVYFTGNNGDSSINLNGYVPLEKEEFESFFDEQAIEDVVRQKVVERILNGESSAK
ncbi:hypothetical protein JOC94_004253 [Bacillus thermophilus]|uniref:Phage protein n=1 Tax=Siminovitchia thermophila TaxID=1245522 RepID=A0ABS2RC41_9BACI|nr:hypothetical protein [Siminovitchia thermophila]MBM7717228.1 hypothetical protein [Siminovitchia thermophila]ONK23003.1 hypothetical protein BLX87_13000 [Bacillus sp. VT-16-64]